MYLFKHNKFRIACEFYHSQMFVFILRSTEQSYCLFGE